MFTAPEQCRTKISRVNGRTLRSQGFSLVEVVLALGIAGFSLVAILGLFTVGLGTNRESTDQMEAANLATLLILKARGELSRQDRGTTAESIFGVWNLTSEPQEIAPQGLLGVGEQGRILPESGRDSAAFALTYRLQLPRADSLEPAVLHLRLLRPSGALSEHKTQFAYEIVTQIRVR